MSRSVLGTSVATWCAVLVVGLLSTVLHPACGSDPEPSGGEGCESDSECKGDRVCDDGECVVVVVSTGGSGTAGAGSGGHGGAAAASDVSCPGTGTECFCGFGAPMPNTTQCNASMYENGLCCFGTPTFDSCTCKGYSCEVVSYGCQCDSGVGSTSGTCSGAVCCATPSGCRCLDEGTTCPGGELEVSSCDAPTFIAEAAGIYCPGGEPVEDCRATLEAL